MVENKNYKLIGLPLYNKQNEANFTNVFSERLYNL